MNFIIKGDQLPIRALEASRTFRNYAARLRSEIKNIIFYRMICKLFKFPNYMQIMKASDNLIGLSNGVLSGNQDSSKHNQERADEIRKYLNINSPQ